MKTNIIVNGPIQLTLFPSDIPVKTGKVKIPFMKPTSGIIKCNMCGKMVDEDKRQRNGYNRIDKKIYCRVCKRNYDKGYRDGKERIRREVRNLLTDFDKLPREEIKERLVKIVNIK